MKSLAEVRDVFSELVREIDILLPESGFDRGIRSHPAPVWDLLGFLARRQSELAEAIACEKSRFLGWLEGEIGVSVQALAGKTQVKSYNTVSDEDVFAVLERNYPARVRPDVSPAREYGATNPARDRILRGLVRSRKMLQPLQDELALASRLTDMVVYKVYGLRDEHVAVVEGSLVRVAEADEE